MMRPQFIEEQIIGILREQESSGRQRRFAGGIDVSETRRLKAREDETGKLKRMLTDAMLDHVMLKDMVRISGEARDSPPSCAPWQRFEADRFRSRLNLQAAPFFRCGPASSVRTGSSAKPASTSPSASIAVSGAADGRRFDFSFSAR